jgi:transposase InsO family protein
VVHAMPRLSPWSRLQLVRRVLAGRPAAHVAAEMGISRTTAYKWLARYRAEGIPGLLDRPSRPHSSPGRTPPEVEAAVVALRRDRRLGPARIAGILGLNTSTVHRILVRHRMPRLAWLDRPSGQPVRRYERARPGELVHVDVKKLGAIRPGGGWRAHGRGSAQENHSRREQLAGRRVGYDYVHCAVDDHTRLAYAEIHPDEKAVTCAGFLRRAAAWFADHGIARIERVMTDNAFAYRRSAAWHQALAELGAQPRRIRPYRPQTNGKAERFNRTLLEEWAYARPFTSSSERAEALPGWLHTYNHHRTHTALGGHPPINRIPVNDLAGQNT